MLKNDNTATTRRQLGELGALAAKTEADERRILAEAEKRLEQVSSKLEELRPRAQVDDEAGAEYTDLVTECGQLEAVIAKAREALA